MAEKPKEGRTDLRPDEKPPTGPGGAKNRPAQECDGADFGQPAGSPGGRGGAVPYGGVKRVEPRTRS